MSKNSRSDMQFLILDACVLIDFIKAEPSIFKAITTYVGSLHVVSVVYEEVDQIDSPKQLKTYGIELVEPEVEDAFEAELTKGMTSFQDNLCYLTAKRHGFACVTNDKKLRSRCTTNKVPIIWGLELIIQLSKAGGISLCVKIDVVSCKAHIRGMGYPIPRKKLTW